MMKIVTEALTEVVHEAMRTARIVGEYELDRSSLSEEEQISDLQQFQCDISFHLGLIAGNLIRIRNLLTPIDESK